MFIKLSLLSLVTPLVAGLTLKISDKVTSGGQVTVSWTTAPGDPATFSLELINQIFHNAFAIANNVIPEQGSIDITLPIVPVGGGYTLNAVDIGNINNVFASTPQFSIADTSSSTASAPSTVATSTGLTTSGGSTVSVPASTHSTTSSPSFGSTRTNAPSSTATSGTSASGSGASPAATFNNAAVSALKINMNMGAAAAVIFSAVAGAVIVAL